MSVNSQTENNGLLNDEIKRIRLISTAIEETLAKEQKKLDELNALQNRLSKLVAIKEDEVKKLNEEKVKIENQRIEEKQKYDLAIKSKEEEASRELLLKKEALDTEYEKLSEDLRLKFERLKLEYEEKTRLKLEADLHQRQDAYSAGVSSLKSSLNSLINSLGDMFKQFKSDDIPIIENSDLSQIEANMEIIDDPVYVTEEIIETYKDHIDILESDYIAQNILQDDIGNKSEKQEANNIVAFDAVKNIQEKERLEDALLEEEDSETISTNNKEKINELMRIQEERLKKISGLQQ